MLDTIAPSPTNGTQDLPVDRLERRLARIERALERLEDAGRAAPGAVAIAVDTFDGLAARLQARGIDLDERLRDAVALAEKLSAPETTRAIERALTLAQKLPAAVATITDIADSLAARVQAGGVDLDERLRVVLRAFERITAPEALATLEAAVDQMHGLRALLGSGVLDPAPVAIVAKAGQALAAAADREPTRAGVFGALRALRDADVQRALGFLLDVARQFGATLDGQRPAGLLPARGGDAS